MARVGFIGAATLTALAGGATLISSAAEFHKLQYEQRAMSAAAVTDENQEARKLIPRMTQSLEFAAGGAVVFIAGSLGAVATGSTLVYSSRRRP